LAELIEHAVTVFLGFFAIMNPIANTAIFAGLVGDMDKSQQFKVAVKALTITFFIILAFAILGKAIFHMFGISLPAFQITGGILVFMVGYHMLQGSGSSMHGGSSKSDAEDSDEGENQANSDIAVSPLAMPLLAGPGTIATAMNYSASGGWSSIIITVSVFAVLCVVTLVCFVFSSKILNVVGKNGLSIITRLMGLILAVIGTQMLMTGVLSALQHVNS